MCDGGGLAPARTLVNEVRQETTRLRAHASSARAARRFLREVLESWRCDEVLEAVLLAANEVVTNAIIHAHSEVELVVRLRSQVIRIEVIDGEMRLPAPRDAPDDSLGGRGLKVVDAVASRWGVDTLPGGKRVWFEVPG